MSMTPLGLVQVLLLAAAGGIAIGNGLGKLPLWPAVLILAIVVLISISLR